MFAENDLVIRKETEIKSASKDMDTYARVIYVSEERNLIALDRYIGRGKISLGEESFTLPLNEVMATRCYEPMSREEISEFRDNLQTLNKRGATFKDTLNVVQQAAEENGQCQEKKTRF